MFATDQFKGSELTVCCDQSHDIYSSGDTNNTEVHTAGIVVLCYSEYILNSHTSHLPRRCPAVLLCSTTNSSSSVFPALETKVI